MCLEKFLGETDLGLKEAIFLWWEEIFRITFSTVLSYLKEMLQVLLVGSHFQHLVPDDFISDKNEWIGRTIRCCDMTALPVTHLESGHMFGEN